MIHNETSSVLIPVFKNKEQEELFAKCAEKAMYENMDDQLKPIEYEQYNNVLESVFATQEQEQQFSESAKKAMNEHIKVRKKGR